MAERPLVLPPEIREPMACHCSSNQHPRRALGAAPRRSLPPHSRRASGFSWFDASRAGVPVRILRQARGPCRLELTGSTCCTAQLHRGALRDQDQSLRVVPTVKVGVTLSLKQVGAQYRYKGLCANRWRCKYSLGTFADLRGLGPVVNDHAMARTHFISNQQTSPIVLTKSTVGCPKAMRYRNDLMRIVTAAPQRHVHNITCTMCRGLPLVAALQTIVVSASRLVAAKEAA
jgi:hypothetical protein